MQKNTQWDGLILNAQLATMRDGQANYGLITDAAIGWKNGQLVFTGPQTQLPDHPEKLCANPESAQQALITPGLIDCHTHLVFAGNRADEFEMRLQGVAYQELAKRGGGILSTVQRTRAASEDQLLKESLPRANALISSGATTIEIKSGYGLDIASERKMLRVARRIEQQLGITVKTSYLAAHAVPPEFSGRSDDYIAQVIDWMQQLHQEQLIDAVDAYCETIAFSSKQVRQIFAAAKNLGLDVKLHADQLSNSGAAKLVAEFRGLSADHLEYSDEIAVKTMAESATIAVLLPGAFHFLRETQRPPIASFRTNKVAMAVASDLNPGTSPLCSLTSAMSLACTHFQLTPEEALQGTTIQAAKALGLSDRGQLVEGMRADFALWPIKHPAELSYWTPAPQPSQLFASGKRIR